MAVQRRLGTVRKGARWLRQPGRPGDDFSRSERLQTDICFTDVLIVGRLDVEGQSFAPIGLHKTDAASDLLLMIHETALHC